MSVIPINTTEVQPPDQLTTSDDVTVRPSLVDEKKKEPLSFFWSRGVYLAELVRVPGKGLGFVVRYMNSPLSTEERAAGHPPLSWIEGYARTGAIRLSSRIADYGTLAELANQLRNFIHRYFDCDPVFESVASLYALHTWVYERFHAVPYLRFLGPAGSGKTRATEVIGALCYHPLVIAGSVTPAPMFRMIEASGGTVVIDEADFRDTDVGAEIMKVLNCGYQRRLPVSRMEPTEGGGYVPRQYQVFGPKIINGRHHFKDEATETRCLSYTPVAIDNDRIPVQLPEHFEKEARDLQNQLLQWRFDILESIVPSGEHIAGISRRMNQIVLPLMTVADLMAGDQAARYRSDLLQFARQIDSQRLAIRAESAEAAVLRALLSSDSWKEPPTCRELCEIAVMDEDSTLAEELKGYLKPRHVGNIARSLGFATHHTRKGTVVIPDPARLRSLAVRFGITVLPATPQQLRLVTM